MTEVIISTIKNINELAMFADPFKKELLKLNISKLARNYLNGKTRLIS